MKTYVKASFLSPLRRRTQASGGLGSVGRAVALVHYLERIALLEQAKHGGIARMFSIRVVLSLDVAHSSVGIDSITNAGYGRASAVPHVRAP